MPPYMKEDWNDFMIVIVHIWMSSGYLLYSILFQ